MIPTAFTAAVTDLVRTARRLVRNEFAEATGGNMSLRVEINPAPPVAAGAPAWPMTAAEPGLDGAVLLVTGTKTRMSDLEADPEGVLGAWVVACGGTGLRLLWGNPRPTSELASHVAVHADAAADRRDLRAVVHCHPPRLTALTHLAEADEPDRLHRILLRMHHETAPVFPDGFAHLPYRSSGTPALAQATRAALARVPLVLWDKHGATAVGETAQAALDRIDVLEKAAAIYLHVASTGRIPAGIRSGA